MVKLRILVVSYLPWRDDVSVGNTLSNLFDGLQEKIEIASIYFKGGMPQNNVTSLDYYIPEKELAKSIITRKKVGYQIDKTENDEYSDENKKGIYNKAREMRWESMLLAQDLIGLLGVWKTENLYKFVEAFNPDIIFGPLGRVPVANLLMKHIHDKYDIPIVAYAWDDHYSLHKKSFSVFFWIKTFLERKYIKECASECEFLYTITSLMKDEYEKYFNKKCRVLYKSYSFEGEPSFQEDICYPIKIVYMGNIGSGRWQVLAKIAKAIERINSEQVKAFLNIYTMSPTSEKMEKALNIPGASELMRPVSNEQVLKIMKSANILLHVEPISEKERLFYRLSFSTKIVDYFYSARCIMAVGGETAAMSYLRDNDAAIVLKEDSNIYMELKELIDNPERILEYGEKSWECGVKKHKRSVVQGKMFSDLINLKREKTLE